MRAKRGEYGETTRLGIDQSRERMESSAMLNRVEAMKMRSKRVGIADHDIGGCGGAKER